jgi:hypothetical protein
MSGAITVLTRESVAEVLAANGSGNWATRADRARKYRYVVLIRNAGDPASPSDKAHGTAFLVGRVSGVRETGDIAGNGKPRIFIEISEFAEVDVPNARAIKSTNPVWYSDFAALGIREEELRFNPILRNPAPHCNGPARKTSKTLGDIKHEIASLFGVPASAVEINIRH